MSRLSPALHLVLPIVLLLTACTSQQPPPTERAQGGAQSGGKVFRIATIGAPPKILHPYPTPEMLTTALGDVWTLLGTGLITLDYDKLDYVVDPRTDMAKALPTITNNGRTFTFQLRDDIKWSDGRPITTDDFLFAYENAIKEENDFVGLDDLERIESINAPDPKTLVVTLKETYNKFIALGFATFSPVPKHVWQGKPWLDPAGNPELLKPTVVNGPYIMKDVSVEGHSYTRNPNWWGKAPALDEIVFTQSSASTVLENLRVRRADWIEAFPPAQFQDAKKIANGNVVEWTGATGSYREIEFNTTRPTLSARGVREALVRAVNRQDVVQYENDLAVPQLGLITQNNTKWVTPGLESYNFDMNRSRQLLQEAGYRLDGSTLRNASGQPVTLEIIWPTSSEPRGKIATYLQQQWKQLGIDVTVTALEFNTFVDRHQRQKDYDVAMGSWQASIDPSAIKEQFRSKGQQNTTSFSNPRFDELMELGLVEQDDTKRKEIYDEAQRLVVSEIPVFPLITMKSFTAFDKSVQGVKPLKGGDLLTQNNMQILDWSIAG